MQEPAISKFQGFLIATMVVSLVTCCFSVRNDLICGISGGVAGVAFLLLFGFADDR